MINGPRILCIRFLLNLIKISSSFFKLEVLMIGELIENVKSNLEKGKKLLVLDEGKPYTVLTFSDYIRYEEQ